jgi:hypothetical protein
MSKFTFLLTLLVAVPVGLLPAAPARAQSIRTFVSVAGNDGNPCSITQPCRHFQAAVNATATGGEVDALDPGAYGSFAISHAITIEGQGWSYVAPPSNGAAITINANAGDRINIRGVSLNGIGVSGSSGIVFNTGGSLNVQNSVARNFAGSGIFFAPTTTSQIFVSNTLLSDNGALGIAIDLTAVATVTGVLDRVVMENNGGAGLSAATNGGTVNLTVGNSVAANNGGDGIAAETILGGTVNVMVRKSTIVKNGAFGLIAQNPGSTIWVTRSTMTGNDTAWTILTGGVVTSYNDNNIDGNTNNNNAPPQIGYK